MFDREGTLSHLHFNLSTCNHIIIVPIATIICNHHLPNDRQMRLIGKGKVKQSFFKISLTTNASSWLRMEQTPVRLIHRFNKGPRNEDVWKPGNNAFNTSYLVIHPSILILALSGRRPVSLEWMGILRTQGDSLSRL